MARLDFQTRPEAYRHWRLEVEPPLARLLLDVDEHGGAFDGYELKLNSYDISVDIELADAVTRLRFEHPEVRAVLLGSARESTFCAGANIRMLAAASHTHKVNFCKFTNETRNAIEDASRISGQRYLAAINGTAAGGGYELALAADHLLLVDDGNAAVSLPEVPLLAVLPGTGGLTRLTDKRRVRRDIADVFCTLEEGMRGQRAVDVRLVDEVAPRSQFDMRVQQRLAALADRPARADHGIELTPLARTIAADTIRYPHLHVDIDRSAAVATVTILGPDAEAPGDAAAAQAQGAAFWPLDMLRALDDALLELRFNEPDIGVVVLKTHGDAARAASHDALLIRERRHWFVREVNALATRVLQRLDLTARSLFALIEPGSCFTGLLAELTLAADRSYMLDGVFEDADSNLPPATLTLSDANFGMHPMVNGISRLACRFLGEPDSLEAAHDAIGRPLDAQRAEATGLVTFACDDLDWDDEVRLAIEARAGFSPDALTGLEANLRFAGPETMESKIFARLSAWQNWIFQRPNATGPEGALPLYGSGRRPRFDRTRT